MKDGWKYDIYVNVSKKAGTPNGYEHIMTKQLHFTAFDQIHVSIIHQTVKAVCEAVRWTCDNFIDTKTPIIIDDESEVEDGNV